MPLPSILKGDNDFFSHGGPCDEKAIMRRELIIFNLQFDAKHTDCNKYKDDDAKEARDSWTNDDLVTKV